MQFYVTNIRPKLHHRKWRKLRLLTYRLFRTFSTSPLMLFCPTFIRKLCCKLPSVVTFHSYIWSKFCLLLLNSVKVPRLLDNSVKIRVIFGVRFKRRKVDKKQLTWKMKHCKLCSRVFWIFLSKLIFTISSYTVSKLVHFWDTVLSVLYTIEKYI